MSQDHKRHIVSNPTTRVKVKGWALCGILCKSPKHYFGPQMRGLIGSPPSPAAPQLRMASSNLAMTHLSFEKRAPKPCEHYVFLGSWPEKGHLASIPAHNAERRCSFRIVYNMWVVGVGISIAFDTRRGSSPTVHSFACVRKGSIIHFFAVLSIWEL